jgi:hypothetical protein
MNCLMPRKKYAQLNVSICLDSVTNVERKLLVNGGSKENRLVVSNRVEQEGRSAIEATGSTSVITNRVKIEYVGVGMLLRRRKGNCEAVVRQQLVAGVEV